MLDPYKKPWPYQKVNRSHPLAKGLVSCWVMNEVAGIPKDSAETRASNIISFSSVPLWKYGNLGSSLWFDGVDDNLIISDHPSTKFGAGDFSVICWIKIAGESADLRWLANRDNVGSSIGWNLLIWNTDAGADSGKVRFNIRGDSGDSILTNAIICTNNWIHYVAVRRSGVLYSYVDSIQQSATAAATGTVSDAVNSHTIMSYASLYRLGGFLSYYSLYDRALTPREVLQHYTNPYQMFEPVFNEVLFGYVAPVAGGLSIPIAYHHYRQLHGN